jgi:hypothetical protein
MVMKRGFNKEESCIKAAEMRLLRSVIAYNRLDVMRHNEIREDFDTSLFVIKDKIESHKKVG